MRFSRPVRAGAIGDMLLAIASRSHLDAHDYSFHGGASIRSMSTIEHRAIALDRHGSVASRGRQRHTTISVTEDSTCDPFSRSFF